VFHFLPSPRSPYVDLPTVSVSLNRDIQADPTLLPHLALERLLDFASGSSPQPLGCQLRCSSTHSMRETLASNDQVTPILVLAAQDDGE
jgi:hypothetical protein